MDNENSIIKCKNIQQCSSIFLLSNSLLIALLTALIVPPAILARFSVNVLIGVFYDDLMAEVSPK